MFAVKLIELTTKYFDKKVHYIILYSFMQILIFTRKITKYC